MFHSIVFLFTAMIAVVSFPLAIASERHPNVVLVITDDQGYGDIAAHGNKVIKTPNLDRLHDESVRFTQFHVDPTCAPTRSALLTGRYSTRVGVWHTILGRSILRKNEVLLPQFFADAGYKTGMFGKWHLGDNYPYRPHDRGFQEAFYHLGGGVSQSPDYWGNNYFDDTYYRNGVPEKTTGYCTDVWFDNAIDFVKRHKNVPFFLYVATNAPHVPLNIDEKYWKPYAEKGLAEPLARFYGMIANIDENLARFDKTLEELGLAENTIFIFMTDNGSAGNGFNAGMRGRKGTPYDGGHRVPFFIRWRNGNFGKPRDIETLTAHIDLVPTLIDVCQLQKPENVVFDGVSLLPLLHSDKQPDNRFDRAIGIEVNRDGIPQPWVRSAFLTQRWRLVNGVELYDMESDPGQNNDLAAQQPEIVTELRKRYMKRWSDVIQGAREWSRIPVGSPVTNSVRLSVHDWNGTGVPAYLDRVTDFVGNGRWAVDVERAGKYRFRLRHFPEESGLPLHATHAALIVNEHRWEKQIELTGSQKSVAEVIFDVDLQAGSAWVETELDDKTHGIYRGAFYVYIELLNELSDTK
ncbi:MAG: arylsulfatase [Planctomycetaceae bacterium]|jgi:arylsulfatase A-like enzyme|nr:arylsulfatase [Planctomycetaceae bacterium]